MKPTRRSVLLGAAALATTRPALAAPRTRLASLGSLKPGVPVPATYPTPQDPVIVLKLGRPARGGVGPDGDVVAYSSLCTHHGCPVRLENDRLLCPCHYSLFDPAVEGQCFQGPAPRELPRVLLELEGDDLYAVGMTALPYGRVSE